MKRYLISFCAALLVSIGIVYFFPVLETFGATIITTNTTDTLETFRTNVNTSLSNLNAALTSGVSTTSPWTIGQVAYVNSTSAVTSVATSSITIDSPLSTSGTAGYQIGGSSYHIGLGVVPIANGGTNGTSYSDRGIVYYNANSQGFSNFSTFVITANKLVGIGTTTPFSVLSVSTSTASSLNTSLFAVASSTNTTLFNVLGSGNVGISSTTPAFTFSVNTVGSEFYIASTGEVVGRDQTNGWTGRISPTHTLVLQSGTTTTWTATTSGAYIPFAVAPFTGTIQQVRCKTDASFLGVEIDINGSAVTPGYFVASTTVGKETITAGNTFTVGDKISAQYGTTTTSGSLSNSCSVDVTETQ